MHIRVKLYLWMLFIGSTSLLAGQVMVDRIEMMPNQPSPYLMRNWKAVTLGYDSLVFDYARTGQYLPLVWRNTSPVNYPEHNSFGLHTVVGTSDPHNSETINVLPAVIGATLVGIDKSNHNGENWVLMCEEYFNRRPEENIYLNQPVAQSGDDWWYTTMPNVFFYQLYDLYPDVGDFAWQFTTIADQWLAAVEKMGGSLTPWKTPYMNYRGWIFSTMKPYSSGVTEPEAAGAIAWMLYNAFIETGYEKYRIGAEWALEFLNNWSANPAYELQLPFGVYAAARMNAELGTRFNVEKMVNWCFDKTLLRHWGAIVGTWGGLDVSGLIGEIYDNDYAFLMNGFEQAGALVPMVRYDDRFARAIGKWMLNLANASRLFYPNYLPANKQDSEAWSYQYDPFSYIGHEALRKSQYNTSPFATGDAITGGWGATNLALYGSSHVGILGGIVDTTNIPMILKLDVRKTDYFNKNAYPTLLFYNPYDAEQIVQLNVGAESHDLYDAVTNTFISFGVSGMTEISLPADEAILLVQCPAAGNITYRYNQMLVNGIVADYNSEMYSGNYPPRIKGLAALPQITSLAETVTLYCAAEDPEMQAITYAWYDNSGQLIGQNMTQQWLAPNELGDYMLFCVVSDDNGGADTSSVALSVIDNHFPVIETLFANPSIINPFETSTLTCQARDEDGDSLVFTWEARQGTITGSGSVVSWTAPADEGYYNVISRVTDARGSSDCDSVGVVVGNLVGFYQLQGNMHDHSVFANHGTTGNVTYTADRFGNPGSAGYFDGIDDFIRIPVHPTLIFQEAITLNFWMQIDGAISDEAYILSHGSWENRWKISLLNDGRLRWTIKTSNGVVDVDSKTKFTADSLYNVCVSYNGVQAAIYINGTANAAVNWTGLITSTGFDLTIAQRFPGDNQYNYPGILDDIRIYNKALSAMEIKALYDIPVTIHKNGNTQIPASTRLLPVFPNPFNTGTIIQYELKDQTQVTIYIYNSLGQIVTTLVDAKQSPGTGKILWNGYDDSGRTVASGIYFIVLQTGDTMNKQKIILLR